MQICSIVLVACLLALCGCKDENPAARRGRLVLRYWEKWTGFEAEAMRQIVNDYNASQDQVFIDFSTVSQIDRKLMLATAGGVPPDLAGLWSNQLAIYAENNALTPLDKLAAENGLRREDYIDVFWDLCLFREHLWALPSTPTSLALIWNKKMFRAAGLDPERPPRSIAELEEFNQKIATHRPDGSLDKMGFLPQQPDWWNAMWGFWFGAELWDGNKRITINSPENIKAYEWLESYPKRFGANNLLALRDGFGNFASPQDPFLSGRLAMELQGVWIYKYIKTYSAPDFEWGVAPLPTAEPDRLKDVTIVESDILVIPAGARHPREAFAFIKYVSSQKQMEKLCLGQEKFSPLRVCSPEFLRNHPNPYISDFLALAKSPNARFAPQISTWTQFAADMRTAAENIWAGKVTAREELNEVEHRQQQILDKRLQRWERHSTRLAEKWSRQ